MLLCHCTFMFYLTPASFLRFPCVMLCIPRPPRVWKFLWSEPMKPKSFDETVTFFLFQKIALLQLTVMEYGLFSSFSPLSVQKRAQRLLPPLGPALSRFPDNMSCWMNAMNTNLIPSASHCQFCSFPVNMSEMEFGLQKDLLSLALSFVFLFCSLWFLRAEELTLEWSLLTTSQVQELSFIPFFSKPQYLPLLKGSTMIHDSFLYEFYAKEMFYQCAFPSPTFPYQHSWEIPAWFILIMCLNVWFSYPHYRSPCFCLSKR